MVVKSSFNMFLRLAFLVILVTNFEWVYGQTAFTIESTASDGSITTAELYREFGEWYGAGSFAKSAAIAPELQNGRLQGKGTRFSFKDTLDASFSFFLDGHPDFFPGAVYDLYVTTPSQSAIDAPNSRFVITDDNHPADNPLMEGLAPLTYRHCGDRWYILASAVKIGEGGTITFHEGSTQPDRFYADSIRLVPSTPESELGIGRRIATDSISHWLNWPTSVLNPAENPFAEALPEGLRFNVMEYEKEAAWRSSLRPVWLDRHPWLILQYRLEGSLSDPPFAFLRLCSTSTRFVTVLTSEKLIADGQLHTASIDLRDYISSPQVIGVELQLRASSVSGTSVLIESLEFRDQPPGYFPPPPESAGIVNTGVEIDLASIDDWIARPEWMSPQNVSDNYTVDLGDEYVRFRVADSLKGMKWTRRLAGTRDIESFPYLLFDYKARNIQARSGDYAVYLNGPDGESRPLYQSSLIDDGAWHTAVVPAGVTSINQIAIQAQSEVSGESSLEIRQLAFADKDPRDDLTWYTSLTQGWDDLNAQIEDFQFIDLSDDFNGSSDRLIPLMDIDSKWFETERVTSNEQIPFEVGLGQQNVICTSLPGDSEVISIELNQRASEIYFLLGAHFPGRENPFIEDLISVIDEAERLYIEVHYTDGTRDEFFPVDTVTNLHQVQNQTFSVLAVPTEKHKIIQSVQVHENSDGGLVALAGLSLRVRGDAQFAEPFLVTLAPPLQEAASPPFVDPAIIYEEDLLILDNTFARYEFDLTNGVSLKSFISKYTGHDLVRADDEIAFFTGRWNDIPFTSKELVTEDVDIDTSMPNPEVTVQLRMDEISPAVGFTLKAGFDDRGAGVFDLAVKNDSQTSGSIGLVFPDLRGLTLGSHQENLFYAYPHQTFVLGNEDIQLSTPYSGYFPLQFMSVFDQNEGWGLSLMTKDTGLIYKEFELEKREASFSMRVGYNGIGREAVASGEKFHTPQTSLSLHPGDWHEGFKIYRQWTSSWYQPVSPRQSWFQEIYTCRRDYPIGGSWYLFNSKIDSYTFPKEIANAKKYIGGADFIDISSWGWSDRSGRVGDYRDYSLGGLANFQEGIQFSQDQGIPVGLYIEGYNLDERSEAYKAYGEKWKMISSTGSDYRNGTEVKICPYNNGWQDYMTQLYMDVASETGADAMYIDVFGLGTFQCFSDSHGHVPGTYTLRGEYEMTRAVRQGLNSIKDGIPLYTEYTPVDLISQHQDGSFSYSVLGGGSSPLPTRTNLFRFAFPDFKQIEIIYALFLARNWTGENLKKVFFNGEGIWIKGDLTSWYDESILRLYRKTHEVFSEHRDALTTLNPEPLIDTGISNVYANRFVAGEKQMLMLYNANWRDVFIPPSPMVKTTKRHLVALLSEQMVSEVDGARVSPRDVDCIVSLPIRITANLEGSALSLEIDQLGAEEKLSLIAIYAESRERVLLNHEQLQESINLLDHFSPEPEKLIIKLLDRGIVEDMVILDSREELSPAMTWTLR